MVAVAVSASRRTFAGVGFVSSASARVVGRRRKDVGRVVWAADASEGVWRADGVAQVGRRAGLGAAAVGSVARRPTAVVSARRVVVAAR